MTAARELQTALDEFNELDILYKEIDNIRCKYNILLGKRNIYFYAILSHQRKLISDDLANENNIFEQYTYYNSLLDYTKTIIENLKTYYFDKLNSYKLICSSLLCNTETLPILTSNDVDECLIAIA